MDNQATKIIKAYLTPQQVRLQLVKPHNHRINATNQAIQTFKNHFIVVLGTTNANFTFQLWDKLAPQVPDSINLLRRSCVHPNCSTNKTLKGPYNCNRYPMDPSGTKAIIYEDSNMHALWAPHGIDAWLLGLSKDHCRCHLYYVPKTNGYCVSSLANLFSQHFIAPPYLHKMHVQELSTELQDTLKNVHRHKRTLQVLQILTGHLDAFVSGIPLLPLLPVPPIVLPEEQRVTSSQHLYTQQFKGWPLPHLLSLPTTRQHHKSFKLSNKRIKE